MSQRVATIWQFKFSHLCTHVTAQGRSERCRHYSGHVEDAYSLQWAATGWCFDSHGLIQSALILLSFTILVQVVICSRK